MTRLAIFFAMVLGALEGVVLQEVHHQMNIFYKLYLDTLPLPPLTGAMLWLGGHPIPRREPLFVMLQLAPWAVIWLLFEWGQRRRPELGRHEISYAMLPFLGNQIMFVLALLGLLDGIKVLLQGMINPSDLISTSGAVVGIIITASCLGALGIKLFMRRTVL